MRRKVFSTLAAAMAVAAFAQPAAAAVVRWDILASGVGSAGTIAGYFDYDSSLHTVGAASFTIKDFVTSGPFNDPAPSPVTITPAAGAFGPAIILFDQNLGHYRYLLDLSFPSGTLSGSSSTSLGADSKISFKDQNYFGLGPTYSVTGTLAPRVSAAAVPEPATWAMMICGFAFTGMTLRKRRRVMAMA